VTAPCQQKFDITLQFIYNIFEVIKMVMKEGTKAITFRVPEELKLQIEMQAFKENRSVNNFLQYVVKEYLETQKKRGYRK
jgi:hypothetical protein